MNDGIAIRYLKQWDIERDPHPVHIVWVPSALYYPLAGHAGNCAKVTSATVTGKGDETCSCGRES